MNSELNSLTLINAPVAYRRHLGCEDIVRYRHSIQVHSAFRDRLQLVPMTSVLDIELLESVYTFLMSNGHEVTAKSLAKEAKLDEKKLKNRKPFDLMDLYPSSLK